MPVKWGKVVQGELAATTDNPPSRTEDGAPGKSTAGIGRQETLDRAPCGVRRLAAAVCRSGLPERAPRVARRPPPRRSKLRPYGGAMPSIVAGHDISCPYEEIRLAASRSAGILPANFWGAIKNQNRRRDGGATRTSRRMAEASPRMRAPSLTALRARKPCPSTQENNAGETPALRKSAGGLNGAALT